MMTVITGVSASGKSEYAERRASELADGGALYYAATMEPYGEEGRQRVERHRRLREGKGFVTIECYRGIGRALDGVDAADRREATVLVECMSNLLANEMFSRAAEPESAELGLTEPAGRDSAADAWRDDGDEQGGRCGRGGERHSEESWERDILDRILYGVAALRGQCRHLVVVTNEVFSDGGAYGEETMVYIKLLGALNQRLVEIADEAVEVVYTIPVNIKLCKQNECDTEGAFYTRFRKDNT